ncbi:MAG: nitronate monooxygenase [Pseudomonadota bacterium]|nr:nitronate monooxygenase [Pseudomonadota bacterium]QKK04314.1 MAG: nitronate monooxygenase [Pseudomonadota bacterium]
MTKKPSKKTDAKTALKEKLDLPLIAAPMFLVSNPDLALACCEEGITGSFPALNCLTSDDFEKWLVQMNDGVEKLATDNPGKKIGPYAVNLIVHESNKRLQEDLELCIKHKVPVIITSLGAVPELVEKVHAYGGIVLHDVTNAYHAKKAADAGVDGIIAVAEGAGGHAGTQDAQTLVEDIRKVFDGIIVLAGGMTTGEDVYNAEKKGADFAYMGTRFINTTESAAPADYKQMIIDAVADDIIYTDAVSGVPANFMRQSLEKAGFDLEELKKGPSGKGKLKPLEEDAKAWKTVWSAGHGVENIDDIPSVSELVTRFKDEYKQAHDQDAKPSNGAGNDNNRKKPSGGLRR